MHRHRRDEPLTLDERRVVEAAEDVIRRALSEVPSTAFADHVILRVASRPSRARTWLPWIALATASAALVAVVTVSRWPAPAARVVAPPPPAAVAANGDQDRPADRAPEAAVSARPTWSPAGRRPTATRSQRQPEVLVPRGQLEAARALSAAFAAAPLEAQPLVIADAGVPTVPRLDEITVTPLVIDWRREP